MARVIIGMSGGVDSAVAAYLLKQQGYEVIGVTLRTWESEDGAESRCCEINDARRIAGILDIPYYPLNYCEEFKEKVISPFINSYINGLTPNPCIECNRYVKWERLLHTARTMGAEYVATGHYAYVIKKDNGRYTIKTAAQASKDQTYMLYKLTQEQLSSTLMPLGGYTKEEVRKIAAEASLPVADKPDSQEICFVTDGHYAEYIETNSTLPIPGEGDFVDEDGNFLGRHKGITHYTVGQRRGLGLAMGHHVFVKKICPDTNEIVISEEGALFTREVICRDVNFLSIPSLDNSPLRCRAKIRYHHTAQDASIEALSPDRVKITFDIPVCAATPGQSSVFYDDDDCVIGGGIIEE